jgi:cytoskeletal protein RodZ
VGRHSAPGEPAGPSIGRVLLLTVLLAAVVVAGAVYLVGGQGDDVTTAADDSSGSSTSSGSPAASASSSASTTGSSASATASPPSSVAEGSPEMSVQPTKQKQAPTLRLELVGTSYVTVRVPGGRTLTSRTYRKGAQLRYDRPRLEVVLGNAGAVQVFVNGRQRKRGDRGQVESFSVRRR